MTMRVFLAKKEVAQSRFDICKTCEQYNASLKLCNVCYCLVLAKVRLSYTACPLDKWTAVEDDPSVKLYDVEKELK